MTFRLAEMLCRSNSLRFVPCFTEFGGGRSGDGVISASLEAKRFDRIEGRSFPGRDEGEGQIQQSSCGARHDGVAEVKYERQARGITDKPGSRKRDNQAENCARP